MLALNRKRQQSMKSKVDTMQLSRTIFLFAILASLCQSLQLTDAQFFTKSSKSIPRMGRRSLQEPAMSALYRRALIDRLVDEYGPNLLEVLQAKAAMENSREVAMKNDQPIDVNDSSSSVYQDNPEVDGGNMSRNERSSLSASASEPISYQRDTSLAMRALNANRLLQALSSGQSLDKIYSQSVNNARQTKYQSSDK